MAFPHMPPVNTIRQLLMFEGYVPRRLRFWLVVMFALFYQLASCIYLGSLTQMVGETTLLAEDYNMGNYCVLIGLNIIFPVLFRWKFGLYTRQLFFISTGMLIVCNIAAMYITVPALLWLCCVVAGYFKMLGMFGCISTIQLNFTPTRNFAVFLPIIYVLVDGAIQISGIMSVYASYFTNWRMMHLAIVVLMLVIDTIVYFMMKHDHRSGPYIPLKGIDWVGQTLWTLTCCIGAWIFVFGEHYDWWDSIEIWRGTWLFILVLGITIVHQHYKKDPFIPLKAFSYKQTWNMCVMLFAMTIISGASHVLQPIYLSGVLHYDSINSASLNLPQLAGDIMGGIFIYFTLCRWKWGVKKSLYMTFFLATYYLASMYFLCYDQTSKEMLYFGVFAMGLAEVMMETIATYYLSQNIPFQHFFMNITIVGFVRCGFGSSIGAAIVERVFNITSTKNYMIAAENITPNNVSDVLMQTYQQQGLMMALKDAYGAAIFVGIIVILIVLMSNYSTTITRYVPRMISVRKWMLNKSAPDPTLS
jgi:hypothetical protein